MYESLQTMNMFYFAIKNNTFQAFEENYMSS